MISWIISTLLTSAATILIAAPFMFRYAVRHTAQNSTSSAKDQTRKTRSNQLKPSLAAFSVTSGVVLFSCVAIYMLSRDQETPGEIALPRLSPLPLTAQSPGSGESPQLTQNAAAADPAVEQLRRFVTGEASSPASGKTGTGLPPVDELVERLSARLQKNPNDISGWRTLGWSQFNLQHYDEAAATYAKAIQYFPNVADLHSLQGEALVQAANGSITENSRQAFDAALKLDPKDLRARFFNGVTKAQSGDKASALDIWIDVANDAGTNETVIPTLRQRIADLAKELNVDANQKLKRPLDVAATTQTPSAAAKDRNIGSSPVVAPAPVKDRDIAAIAPTAPPPDTSATPSNPADQTAMIKGMVERLTNRLNQSPRDVDGWVMLMRSRMVLNDPQAAQEALSRALKVFEQPSPERDRLTAAAKDFGLKP